MLISGIVAMAENRVIGKNNQLPWHLPADLRHFKNITLGKPVLMGRKTYESIGKPLPDRLNIVITTDKEFSAPGCVVVNSIPEAIQVASPCNEAVVIGGALLFEQMMRLIKRFYMTIVHHPCDGDVFFPSISEEWKEISREFHPADSENPYAYSLCVLER